MKTLDEAAAMVILPKNFNSYCEVVRAVLDSKLVDKTISEISLDLIANGRGSALRHVLVAVGVLIGIEMEKSEEVIK